MVNWLGKPMGNNKPINFFKSNSKTLPVNMFKDSDGDGVADVFDCKPHNKNKQGFIDAVIGAVKGMGSGGMKKGWSEGMAREGNPVSRRYARARKMEVQREIQRFATQPGEKERASLPGQLSSSKMYRLQRGNIRAKREARIQKFKQTMSAIGRKTPVLSEMLHPVDVKGRPTTYSQKIAKMRETVQKMKITPVMRRQLIAVKKSARMLFPVIPAGATTVSYGIQSKKGTGGGRGRPVRSFDPRYAQYGGVFGYRRFQSEQRRAFREQLRRQQEAMRVQRQMQRVQQMPSYEQVTPQTQQVPQEMQGAVPDYSQFEQMQQQIPQQMQVPQEMQVQQVQVPQYVQPQPTQREIVTPFKGSGGHPYPAVDRRPLTPSRQTINQGFVESVDSFTGRRFMKALPRTERWSGGGQ